MKIQKGDKIIIITGKDRGKTGKVEKTYPAKQMILIEGVNIFKKHIKPTKRNPQGGIIDVVKPLKLSNVMLICPHCSKATRIGIKNTDKGKIRICRRCHESVGEE